MPPLVDLKGMIFGNLIVRCRGEDAVRPSGAHVPRWWCLCNCGNMMPVLVEGGELKRGQTVSCGCHKGFISGHKNKIHGETKSCEYSTWLGIHRRCYHVGDRFYRSYGGRGIKVCSRWHRDNPEGLRNFISDMGRRPAGDFSIERVDVNGDYCPDNCIWIHSRDQCRNRTTSRYLSYCGVTGIQSDWARILNVYPARIQYHMWSGKSFPEVVEFICRKNPSVIGKVKSFVGGKHDPV